MKALVKSVLRQLPLLLFILAVLFSGYTAVCFPANFIDSDLSSELILAKLLAAQNKLITSDWFYSTEIRFFHTNLVYMPLFKIFSDWSMVRTAASLIFLALILGSYFYLSRQLRFGKNAFFISASLLILPASVLYGRTILYQNYYSPFIVYGFLIFGLYLSVLRHRGQRRGKQIPRIVLLTALVVISCLNGFRQLPFTMLPILLVALYLAVRAYWQGGRKLSGIPGETWTAIWLAAGMCAAGLLGLAVHMKILPLFSNYQLLNQLSLQLASPQQIQYIAESYLNLFGYQKERALLTFGGMANIAGILAAAAMIILSFSVFFRKQEGLFRRAGLLMYPAAMLITLMIFLLTTGAENYPQYFISAFIWLFPLLGLLISETKLSWRRPTFRQALAGLMVLCLAVSGVFYNRYFITPEGKQVVYDGYSFVKSDFLKRQEGVVTFLKDNGYEVGYATFWQANSITEATDGRVAMISIEDGDTAGTYRYADWLTSKTLRSLSAVEGKKVFLLLSAEEISYFQDHPLYETASLVYEDTYYRIFTFPSSTTLRDMLQPEETP